MVFFGVFRSLDVFLPGMVFSVPIVFSVPRRVFSVPGFFLFPPDGCLSVERSRTDGCFIYVPEGFVSFLDGFFAVGRGCLLLPAVAG